jgi:hypothetical protein
MRIEFHRQAHRRLRQIGVHDYAAAGCDRRNLIPALYPLAVQFRRTRSNLG